MSADKAIFGYYIDLDERGDFYADVRDAAAIMVEVGACDEEALIIQRAPHDGSGERPRVGSISLVYGNDGWDVMADNTATDEMASLMAGADRLSDELGDLLSQELIASRQHSLG